VYVSQYYHLLIKNNKMINVKIYNNYKSIIFISVFAELYLIYI